MRGLPAGRQGFALLIAIIFVSVVLSLALTLGSLGYKQLVISRSASDSQYAFYAADAALECALIVAEGGAGIENPFAYTSHDSGDTFPCIKAFSMYPPGSRDVGYTAIQRTTLWRIDIDYPDLNNIVTGNGNLCADVTVIAPSDLNQYTYVIAQGYSVPCSKLTSGVSFSARGLYAQFK